MRGTSARAGHDHSGIHLAQTARQFRHRRGESIGLPPHGIGSLADLLFHSPGVLLCGVHLR